MPWITVEWLGVLNYNKKTIEDVSINPNHIIELLQLLQQQKITPLGAKDIMRKFIPKSFSPKKQAQASKKINNEKELSKIIKQILKTNQKSVLEYKSGNKKIINFLMGKIMQETNKRADFQVARKVLEKELN